MLHIKYLSLGILYVNGISLLLMINNCVATKENLKREKRWCEIFLDFAFFL